MEAAFQNVASAAAAAAAAAGAASAGSLAAAPVLPSVVRALPAPPPIFVNVSDAVCEPPRSAPSRCNSTWVSTAVVLLGALVAVILISRVLGLSQRVFELESKPSVEDDHLKVLVKAHIDETVREMEAAARQQHAARVQQIQKMQAAQQAAEEEEARTKAATLSEQAQMSAAVEVEELDQESDSASEAVSEATSEAAASPPAEVPAPVFVAESGVPASATAAEVVVETASKKRSAPASRKKAAVIRT